MEEIREESESVTGERKEVPAVSGLESPFSPEKSLSPEVYPETRGEQAGQEKIGELMAKMSAQAAVLTPANPNDLHADAKELADGDESARIEKLMQLADTKGVTHAVKVALTLQDFYALDMMRDELVERFHEKLTSELGAKQV